MTSYIFKNMAIGLPRFKLELEPNRQGTKQTYRKMSDFVFCQNSKNTVQEILRVLEMTTANVTMVMLVSHHVFSFLLFLSFVFCQTDSSQCNFKNNFNVIITRQFYVI